MIELKDLRKSYKVGDFEQKALDGVSITFRDNEFVAVLGPSGSGKTTLLNILGGLDHADTGELIINGVSTRDYKSADWDTYRNHHIGFIFQSYNLIPHQTVLSNVELALTLSGVPRAERRKRAIAELERVGLGEHINKKPNQLSGGQMQRVAIARALVNDPDIVLADEPTGALDTETGLQVMDLLQDIASDRLVIMVTHNPELAHDYANRIVKLHDGKITDDSNPFNPATSPADAHELEEYEDTDVFSAGADLRSARSAIDTPAGRPKVDPSENTSPSQDAPRTEAPKGRKKHASMSFLTALSLSFTNLMTKKGRTFLTAFAGSIGIIGIAAILALSNGVNNYIAKVEEDTLSSSPLVITQSSFDITSIMVQAGEYENKEVDQETLDSGEIPEVTLMADILRDVKTNDLESLRTFFESPQSEMDKYTNAIVYSYGIVPQIYKADTSDGIKQLNPGSLSNMMSNTMTSTAGFSSLASSNSFQEMLDDQHLLEEQYNLVAGTWPTNYDECILIINENGCISDYTLYSIGVLDPDELKDLLMKAISSDDLEVPDTSATFTQQEALNMSFKVVNKCNMYTKSSSGNTWVDRSDDTDYMKEQIANGIDLKIVGIVKQSPTASATSLDEGVGYRHDLILHLIEQAADSPVVKAQEADPEVDIFTGKTFKELEDDAGDSFDMGSLFSVDSAMMASAFKVDSKSVTDALTGAMTSAGKNLDTKNMFNDIPAPDFSDMTIDMSGGAPDADQAQGMVQALNGVAAGSIGGFMKFYMPKMAQYPPTQEGMQKAVADYQATDEYKQIVSSAANAITSSSASASEKMQEAFKKAVSEKMGEYMKDQLAPYLQKKMGGVLESYSKNLGVSMASALTKAMGKAVSFDAGVFSRAITVNMDQDELTSMFMSFAKAKDLTYESNLMTLGYANIADPDSIKIYAKSFDDKTKVEEIIDNYNTEMQDKGEPEKVVSYSDIMGVLMKSVTSIVNMISTVLIAFVAISLVVSSIMIGIITYISVLERKKEIGILRAMGASKGNIANIFNAETFIEGLMSGVFAVVLVALVSIPVNAIVLSIFNVSGIMALPLISAIVLVIISVALTFIAGLMPAMNAARRDPVEALRSE